MPRTVITKLRNGPSHAVTSILLCLALWQLGSARAYSVVDANSQSNTNPPPDGAPWSNVGSVNGASGIYLGSSWMLTAAHVGPGGVNLSGLFFPFDGTAYRLTNSNGSATDMLLFHLGTTPTLSGVTLAASTPAALSQVDMIGFGHIAGSSQTTFGSYTGFNWSVNTFKSWGNNKINSGGVTTINAGAGDISVFTTDFTSPTTSGSTAQTSHEAEASTGDSGGGVFRLNGAQWELVGMLDAIGNLASQPASTAVYGDFTYCGNIPSYRSQILSLMASTLQVSISRSGNSVQVCWPQAANGFNLESTDSLVTPHWTTVRQNLTTTNGQGCVLLPTTTSMRFFRLHGP